MFLIISFSGNRLLAGLKMKRPSIYIDQWTEKNAQWHPVEDINVQSQYNDDSQYLGLLKITFLFLIFLFDLLISFIRL